MEVVSMLKRSLARYWTESAYLLQRGLGLQQRGLQVAAVGRIDSLTQSNSDGSGESGRLGGMSIRVPETPATVLSRLSHSKDPQVLARVASHPGVSIETLRRLAESEYHEIRQEVTENASTPHSVLLRLTGDVHPDVRYRMAENPRLSETLLRILMEDENPYVSCRAEQSIETKRRSQTRKTQ